MKCEFCGSALPAEGGKCPRCGASQGADISLPLPSPYYKAVMPPEPIVPPEPVSPAVLPETPTQPVEALPPADIPSIITSAKPVMPDRGIYALIAFITGLAGIPLALFTLGCSSPINLIGIGLALMGLKSNRKGLAIAGFILNTATIVIIVIVIILAGYYIFAN